MLAAHSTCKRYPLWAILVGLALTLAACSQAASVSEEAGNQYTGAPEPPRQAAPGEGASGGSQDAVGQDLPGKRIVIQNAQVSVVVADPRQTLQAIAAMAEEMGGFVVTSNLYQSRLESGAEVPRGSITIRVPSERLEEALGRIEAASDRPPLRRAIESQDVTSEYTDLQSRLRNLQATEAQLVEIMQAADETEEVMSVYNRLVEVRGDIEVTQGRIQYYEQSAALSSIQVELLVNEAVQPLTIGTWEPKGVARNALQALIDTLKFLAIAAIWVVVWLLPVLLVVWLVFILPLTLIVRAIRRRRRQVLPPAPPPPTPD